VAWPVSRRVNTPKNNHASLIERESLAIEIRQGNVPGTEQLTVSIIPLDPGKPILE